MDNQTWEEYLAEAILEEQKHSTPQKTSENKQSLLKPVQNVPAESWLQLKQSVSKPSIQKGAFENAKKAYGKQRKKIWW